MRPIAACAMMVAKLTRVSQVTPEIDRHSPRNGFNGFLRALLGDRLSCHRRFADNSTKLDASIGASGPHDFTVRIRRARLAAPSASTAFRPTLMTLRNVPLSGRDGRGYRFDLG